MGNSNIDNSIDRAYSEVIGTYPYNGPARILRLQGETVPENFGGSCREQVKKLMERLKREVGWSFKIPYDTTMVHSALIARNSEGDRFFADLSLMMREAVKMEFIPAAPEVYCVDTFPTVGSERGRGELSLEGETICLKWEVPMMRGDRCVRVGKKKHRFNDWLDPENFLNDGDPAKAQRELQWNAWQKSLYWNVLNSVDGDLRTVRVMANGKIEARISKNMTVIRDDDGNGFEAVMEEIADCIKSTRTEVKEFLELGSRKFAELVANRT